ncbi:MAG TPA: hypothetical protein VLA00_19190 [Xanthobacteraceae bacterium]|nr:hypothetical protein [Xanthobacteraceae bacterium]
MRGLIAGLTIGLLLLPGLARAADPVFPNQGSVGLVPPPGMVEIPGAPGFQDAAAKASILIAELPADAYAAVGADLTDAKMAEKGIEVDRRQELALADGSPALLIAGRQTGPVPLRRWLLLAGGKQAAALLTAQVPDSAAETYGEAAIEAALRSVAFRAPPTTEELMARLPFRIDLPDGYRIAKVMGPTSVMVAKATPGSAAAGRAEVASMPLFIVGIVQGDVREDERERFARRAIASVPGVKELRPDRGGPQRIGGQPGFEIVASAEDVQSGAPLKVAQWLRFGKASYIRMIGIAPAEGFDASFNELRALRDAVELR